MSDMNLSEVGKSYELYKRDVLACGWMPCEERAWNRMKPVYREHWHLQALIQLQGMRQLREQESRDADG